ncbi:unnamed protein product, partial [Tetraodon nigroviridis]
MSLDDIIRLNKKEQQIKKRQATVIRRPVKKKGRINQGRGVPKTAGAVARGGRNKRLLPPQGRRRGQGVITGLAARRPAALLRRGTLNRAALNQKTKARFSVQRPGALHRKPEVPRSYWQPEPQRGRDAAAVRRPFRLQRRPPAAVPQAQREARQATFLFRRGLKIQAQVHKPSAPAPPVRTRQWRSLPSNSGILTISIDNPTARTQPEPPSAWTLHPPASTSVPAVVEAVEKKVPKGVPLQFDINSVGKPQTAMTLNERFRILKDKRAAAAQAAKGSRFVTVG